MDSFQKISRTGMNVRRYQQKLKKELKEWFPDQLLLLTTKLNTAEIVVSVKNGSSDVLSDDTSCWECKMFTGR